MNAPDRWSRYRENNSKRPHGDARRYWAGCRCDDCRAAMRAARQQQRVEVRKGQRLRNAIVPADRARAHILALSVAGVGTPSIAAVSDIAQSVVERVRTGAQRNLRENTERALLAVTEAAVADGTHIPSGPSKALLSELREEGYSERDLLRMLGYQGKQLKIKRLITVRNADRIARLHRALTSEALVPVSFGKPRRKPAAPHAAA
jgi:hypothetical protein